MTFFAENEASLFRNNTTGLRLLSTFAKIHGYTYLRSLVEPLVKIMHDRPGHKSYDIDPLRATSQNRDENLKSVETVASAFLELITSSVHSFPPYVCTKRESMQLKFPQDVARIVRSYRKGSVSRGNTL